MIKTGIPARVGTLAMDADGSLPKERRIRTTTNYIETSPESQEGLGDFPASKASDVLNAFTLKANNKGGKLMPRGGYGSWSFCVPMVKEKKGWRPLQNIKGPDDNFEYQQVTTFGIANPPIGTIALVTATVGHGERQLVGVIPNGNTPNGNPIISHWNPNNPPQYSTHVFEIRGDTPDAIIHAGFHTFTRVQQYEEPCTFFAGAKKTLVGKPPIKYAVALNGTDLNGDKTGMLFTHFAGANAMLSYESWGPLRFATTYHQLNSLGDRSGAIDTDALYTGGNPGYDMPLPFEEKDEKNPAISIFDYRVFLWRRKKWKRDWLCEKKEHRWDLHTKIPITETPPCNPTKVPEKDGSVVPQLKRSFGVANIIFGGGFIGSPSGFALMGRPNLLYGRWPNVSK